MTFLSTDCGREATERTASDRMSMRLGKFRNPFIAGIVGSGDCGARVLLRMVAFAVAAEEDVIALECKE